MSKLDYNYQLILVVLLVMLGMLGFAAIGALLMFFFAFL